MLRHNSTQVAKQNNKTSHEYNVKSACKLRLNTSHIMYYSFQKRGQTNRAFLAKHKNRRANPGMIQAILWISRSINVCGQMLTFWRSTKTGKHSHEHNIKGLKKLKLPIPIAIFAFLMRQNKKGEKKSAYEPTGPSGWSSYVYCSMKRLSLFLPPPGWDAGPSQGYPQHQIAGIPGIPSIPVPVPYSNFPVFQPNPKNPLRVGDFLGADSYSLITLRTE